MTAPKTFVSYSWTSPQHQQWVIELATQLREHGVDVILDKWDLREGQDSTAFMERMVTDPNVQKVVMVFDRAYAEKADKRAGGVGTETQIISSEVYNKVEQTKFVGVASELDADGKAYTPAYYKSRIYIDLSSDEIYASNFEQLLRWIFDKPLHVKPTLGRVPEFLADDAITLGTASKARRARDLIHTAAANAVPALEDYFEAFAEGLENFRISAGQKPHEFDELVVKSIDAELPYRNEFIAVTRAVARFWNPQYIDNIHRFFERVAIYQFRSIKMTSYRDWDFDNFRFIVHELFLYALAILLREQRFVEAGDWLDRNYYLGEVTPNAKEPMADFTVFNEYLNSLEHRNQRLGLRRLSLHADLIQQRSHASGMPFEDIMQADFVLFLRQHLRGQSGMRHWSPVTLLYVGRLRQRPFEIFARAQSRRHFERIKVVLGTSEKSEFDTIMTEFAEGRRDVPRWQFEFVDPLVLANWTELCKAP
jgi:hypothetical protein